MKNKKLFAILTLVAFMLTMMPVMAFATTSDEIGVWVEDGSALVESNVAVNEKSKKVVFCVSIPAGFGTGESLYVYGTKAGTNEIVSIAAVDQIRAIAGGSNFTRIDATGTAKTAAEGGEALRFTGACEATFELVNATPAQVDLHAVLVKGTQHNTLSTVQVINKYPKGNDGTNSFTNVAFDGSTAVDGSYTVKFISNEVVVPVIGVTAKDQGDNLVSFTSSTVNGVATETASAGDAEIANNGLNNYEVTVTLTQGSAAVKNADIAVSTNKVGVFVNENVITTNNRGVAKFNVSASKAGVYTINLAYGDVVKNVVFTFESAQIGSVTPAKVTGNFATGNTVADAFYIDLSATDTNGNALTAAEIVTKLGAGTVRHFQFVKVPETSAFDTENATALDASGTDSSLVAGDFVVTINPATGNAALRIYTNVAGDYTLKMYAPVTGSDVQYINFSTKKYDKTVQAVVTYGSDTYYLGSAVPAPTITVIDANGTKKNIISANFAARGVQLAYTGVGVTNWANGAFTVTDNEDYLGKEIVVTAVVDNCFATTTLKIADVPAYLNFTDAKAAVGTEATVPVVSLDLNGNLAALGTVTFTPATDVTAVVTSKPAGAIVSVDYATSLSKFATTGKGAIKVASNKPGTVTVNVIIKADTNGGAAGGEVYLTGIATVNFGDEATPVQQSATLIIGSNVFVANGGVQTAPAAPVIIDGRTYLPIRAVGQSIGAQVDYVDGVITLTLGAQKATMVPGSNVMTVGTETVTMDAAPYLAGDGHTMVPVRYAAQAFGYELGTTTNADGSVATVTIFK